ncbi:MAG: hypothetical protein JRG76_00085 [Deltaproteobacteria bacterium]|nr:hypothetical protein [Deltaproteobacteria bacterium]MBW2412877.1 hypothetical protein [Deltaproteobacteria bacterium]
MGWLRGDLRRLPATLADLAPPAPRPKDAAEDAATHTGAELTPEDQKVLDALEMLMDLELLEDWDPHEDLPIPVAPSAPPEAPGVEKLR